MDGKQPGLDDYEQTNVNSGVPSVGVVAEILWIGKPGSLKSLNLGKLD
jgi:hypothetical protein